MFTRSLSLLSVGLTVLSLTAIGPPPTRAQQDLPGVFSEVLEVRVVNVEIVVTDRDGVRVPGLQAGDFQLLVDGEEVPIEFFTEIRGGEAIADGAGSASGISNVPAVSPGEPVGTSYLLFIDEYFSIARDNDLVLNALREQLPLLGPNDRMAIVAYDGQKMDMLSSWSQSVEELDDALKEASRRHLYGLQRAAERRSWDLRLRLTDSRSLGPSALTQTQLDPEERFYAEMLTEQVQRVVLATTATLRSFAAPPGRKVMLILSGGWPYSPANYVVNDFSRAIIEPGLPRSEELYAPLADTANLLGYTLYTVDVPGLEATNTDVNQTTPTDIASPLSLSFERESEVQFTLDYLARATGGESYLNARRGEAFQRAVQDTRTYYWMGFTPTWSGNDEPHEIKVEVLRPGLKLRSRRGFLDSSRQREVTMAVESALLFGSPPSSQPLEVRVGNMKKAGRGKMTVPVLLAIPVDAITLLPRGNELVAQLELRVAALSEDGATSDIPVYPLEFTFKERPGAGKYIPYQTELKLRRKSHNLVVAIYDPASGSTLSSTLEVRP